MNNLLSSVLGGFCCLAALFLICLIFVVGVKVIYLSVKKYISAGKPAPAPQVRKPKAPPKPRKPIRSIEINPEEVDRIYVKKIS